MLTTLISFFGGSVFRMIWGEASSWITARQDHRHELERIKLEGDLDAARHARELDSIKQQHVMGVEVVRVKAEADIERLDAEMFGRAVELTGKPTGVAWVDGWNGAIRPLLATICISLWVLHVHRAGWVLDGQGWAIVGAALGVFVADRSLLKRGK